MKIIKKFDDEESRKLQIRKIAISSFIDAKKLEKENIEKDINDIRKDKVEAEKLYKEKELKLDDLENDILILKNDLTKQDKIQKEENTKTDKLKTYNEDLEKQLLLDEKKSDSYIYAQKEIAKKELKSIEEKANEFKKEVKDLEEKQRLTALLIEDKIGRMKRIKTYNSRLIEENKNINEETKANRLKNEYYKQSNKNIERLILDKKKDLDLLKEKIEEYNDYLDKKRIEIKNIKLKKEAVAKELELMQKDKFAQAIRDKQLDEREIFIKDLYKIANYPYPKR